MLIDYPQKRRNHENTLKEPLKTTRNHEEDYENHPNTIKYFGKPTIYNKNMTLEKSVNNVQHHKKIDHCIPSKGPEIRLKLTLNFETKPFSEMLHMNISRF